MKKCIFVLIIPTDSIGSSGQSSDNSRVEKNEISKKISKQLSETGRDKNWRRNIDMSTEGGNGMSSFDWIGMAYI